MFASQSVASVDVKRQDQERGDPDREIKNVKHRKLSMAARQQIDRPGLPGAAVWALGRRATMWRKMDIGSSGLRRRLYINSI
jgi:hypothetical protein